MIDGKGGSYIIGIGSRLESAYPGRRLLPELQTHPYQAQQVAQARRSRHDRPGQNTQNSFQTLL